MNEREALTADLRYEAGRQGWNLPALLNKAADALSQPSPAVPVASRHCESCAWSAPQPTEPAQPAVQAEAPSLEWAVQGWRAEVKHRPLVNEHRRSLDWMWRKMVRRFGGDPDALLGPDHDVMQGFAPMPLHKASPGPDPTTEQPGDAETVELIVRDCCETDPADPDQHNTICISVSDLRGVLQSHIDAARAAHGKGGA